MMRTIKSNGLTLKNIKRGDGRVTVVTTGEGEEYAFTRMYVGSEYSSDQLSAIEFLGDAHTEQNQEIIGQMLSQIESGQARKTDRLRDGTIRYVNEVE